MLRSLPFVLSGLLGALSAQETPPPAPVDARPRVDVPTFANPTCPIMGKKVSMPLFVDTDLGRFYVCCKPCYKKVLRDLPTAHKTAYPNIEVHGNTVCPVAGEPIGEHAVEVTLQGHRFKVCCEDCIARAREHSQVTLVKVTDAATVDVGNTTCPVTGKPVVANLFVRIDGNLVHLASTGAVVEVEKDPAGVLAKARTIAAAQPAKPKHVHRAAGATPAPAGKTPSDGTGK